MGRSTVHYADSDTNRILKKLHNKLRPAGTPVQRVEYIIELLLLRIFEVKLIQDAEFIPLRELFRSNPDAEKARFLYACAADGRRRRWEWRWHYCRYVAFGALTNSVGWAVLISRTGED